MIPINIFEKKSEINTMQMMNSLPGFVPFCLLILNQLFLGFDWAFYFLFLCSVIGLFFVFFPFYFNSKLFVSLQGIELHKGRSIRRIPWSEVKEIDIVASEPESNYDSYKCYIVLDDDSKVRFYISRYLFKGRNQMLVRVLDSLIAFGGSDLKFTEIAIKLYEYLKK